MGSRLFLKTILKSIAMRIHPAETAVGTGTELSNNKAIVNSSSMYLTLPRYMTFVTSSALSSSWSSKGSAPLFSCTIGPTEHLGIAMTLRLFDGKDDLDLYFRFCQALSRCSLNETELFLFSALFRKSLSLNETELFFFLSFYPE